MPGVNEVLEFNRQFVERDGHVAHLSDKYPDRKLSIVTCMDTRLTVLLMQALGLKNGEVTLITTAGGVIQSPWGTIARSLLISVFELGVEEIMVIGHTDCGFQHTNPVHIEESMKTRGLEVTEPERLDPWMRGFGDLDESIRSSVKLLKDHPLMPDDVVVRGFRIDSETGELTEVA